MSGFRKARAEQAALKMSLYGPPGSGKTFTALLLAEGLARLAGRRVAYVDTERGTDFYTKPVPERAAHPGAFDFDAIYTRSLTEVLKEVKALRADDYAVLVIDSITHLWDAVPASYSGRRTSQGGIPMQAWDKLKAPYKELMNWCVNSPLHVFLLGRQGTQFEDSDGELKAVGLKMRAEKETAHEPHVCVRMECVYELTRGKRVGLGVPTAFVEKDRSGMLHGAVIEWPTFASLAQPLVGLLGTTQAVVQSEEDAAFQDVEALSKNERERGASSRITREQFEARLTLSRDLAAVEAIGKEITPAVKKAMLKEDVESLRNAFLAARDKAKGLVTQAPAANGRAESEAPASTEQ